MNIYSTAAPVVSASITTKGKTEDTVNVVGKGDTIADLVLEAEYPCRPDVEIKEATVLGFFLGDLQVPRGVTRVYDGVPTYYQDPDGNGNRGLVDETMCVKAMLIEIPAEEEGGKPITMKVVIDRIKALPPMAATTRSLMAARLVTLPMCAPSPRPAPPPPTIPLARSTRPTTPSKA